MIRVEGLTKRYGPIVAVDGVSFDVERGETLAIIGPNGAGKTTTLKALLGLVRPDAGAIAIGPAARPPHDPGARRDIGYVPQRVEFPAGRTVGEVLRFFSDLRGLPAAAVGHALERVGLEGHAARRAGELSGGFVQRLSLAQALLGDPAILVLDEPTASLDPQATWEFRSLVQRLQAEGKTVLLCSHLLSEVERVADRVLILVAGRRAAIERMQELHARQVRNTRLLVDLDGDVDRARVALGAGGFAVEDAGGTSLVIESADARFFEALGALRAAAIVPRSFELQRPTLEEVFLAVVRGERGERQP